MKIILRAAFIGAAAAVAVGLGTNSAVAVPYAPVPEPGGLIRIDLPAGEWWNCQGLSAAPPFIQYGPAYYQYTLGPNPIFLRFTPGSDVWVSCSGSAAPVIWYGPIVKAGN